MRRASYGEQNSLSPYELSRPSGCHLMLRTGRIPQYVDGNLAKLRLMVCQRSLGLFSSQVECTRIGGPISSTKWDRFRTGKYSEVDATQQIRRR